MVIDYKKYPPNWKKEIRPRILERANHKCEFCGVDNYSIRFNGKKDIKVVLTIAHLDHDPDNWDVEDERLAALCQKCHMNYDKNGKQNRMFYKCNMKGCDRNHHANGLCKACNMKILRKKWGYNSRSREMAE